MKSWVKGHGERILSGSNATYSLDRRPSDCGSDSARIADDGEAHRKTRRVGNCASRARQLRPGVPLRHRHGRAKHDPTGDLRGALPAVKT